VLYLHNNDPKAKRKFTCERENSCLIFVFLAFDFCRFSVVIRIVHPLRLIQQIQHLKLPHLYILASIIGWYLDWLLSWWCSFPFNWTTVWFIFV